MKDYGAEFAEETIEEVEKRLRKIYKSVSKEMEEKANVFLKKYKEQIEEMQSKYARGDITKKELNRWTKNKLLRLDQIQQSAKSLAEDMYAINKDVNDWINEESVGVFMENANFAAYDMENQMKAYGVFDLYDKHTVRDLQMTQKSLFKYKDVAWNNRNIKNSITKSVLEGESIPKTAKRLGEALGSKNRKSMELIARTAMTSAQNQGRLSRYEEAESLGIKLNKVWLSTHDDRTRESHVYMDGESVDIHEEFSNGLQYPGDSDGEPEEVYNCRCTMITEIEDYPSKYENLHSKGSYSYEEWKELND